MTVSAGVVEWRICSLLMTSIGVFLTLACAGQVMWKAIVVGDHRDLCYSVLGVCVVVTSTLSWIGIWTFFVSVSRDPLSGCLGKYCDCANSELIEMT
jgi:hypothetical protein